MNNTFHTLEFDHILRQLEELACTKSAKERIRSMEPYLYEGDVGRLSVSRTAGIGRYDADGGKTPEGLFEPVQIFKHKSGLL